MIEQTLFSLGAFRCDTMQLNPGEHIVELLGGRPCALILLRGAITMAGKPVRRLRPVTISGTVRLEALESSLVGRLMLTGENSAHLGG